MSNVPSRRPATYLYGASSKQAQRTLSGMDDRQEIELAHVRIEAELAASVIEARNALGAAAALADAKLSMAMRAVPANDTSDLQFRMAIQEAVRTGVIADILNFNP